MIEYPAHDRYVTVTPALATITVHTGNGDGIESWRYRTEAGAHTALLSWQGRQFKGEPRGWIHHSPSGRYREDGDPNRECILTSAEWLIRLSWKKDEQ